MSHLEVSFGGSTKVAYCDKITEGDNGLFLLTEHDEQIGYVPYDELDYVRSPETTDAPT